MVDDTRKRLLKMLVALAWADGRVDEEEIEVRIREVRQLLEELRQRKPIHSVPPWYFTQEEDLEEELERLVQRLESFR